MQKTFIHSLIKIKLKSNHIMDFLLSLLFVLIYFESTKEWKYAKLEDLASFNAYNPFQFRVLIPFIVNIIIRILPGFSYIFAYQLILLLTTFILARCTRIYIREYFEEESYNNIGILVLFYILFWNYAALGIWLHPADIPAILFFLLGLIFIKRNKFTIYYPLFIIACFNRETIIMILVAFIISRKNLREVIFNSFQILLYLLTWLVIKYILYYVFQNNPTEIPNGNLLLIKVKENIDFFVGLIELDKFYILRIFAFGAIYFFIPHFIKKLDMLNKRLLLIIPIYVIIIFIVGKFQEIRIFSEIVPLFIIPGILTIEEKYMI